MKKLHLPCLRGVFGSWTYFSTVIKVKDLVTEGRVITVSESSELYSKNINEVLQREIDKKRIKTIKEYLLTIQDRFFSSLIVAIHKGDPRWADFDIEKQFRVDNEIIDEEQAEFIENKLGVLTLSGNEEIFVLDGQHRLLGLRESYKANNEIGNDEVSIIFVVHNIKTKERTR
jgi:DNA sulfur modification protein DndB